MSEAQIIAYLIVALGTAGVSLALLGVTKIPSIVIIGSAAIIAAAYSAYFRIVTGFWDKFAVLEFFWVAGYACTVSFALIGIGRYLGWRFFLNKRPEPVHKPTLAQKDVNHN